MERKNNQVRRKSKRVKSEVALKEGRKIDQIRKNGESLRLKEQMLKS